MPRCAASNSHGPGRKVRGGWGTPHMKGAHRTCCAKAPTERNGELMECDLHSHSHTCTAGSEQSRTRNIRAIRRNKKRGRSKNKQASKRRAACRGAHLAAISRVPMSHAIAIDMNNSRARSRRREREVHQRGNEEVLHKCTHRQSTSTMSTRKKRQRTSTSVSSALRPKRVMAWQRSSGQLPQQNCSVLYHFFQCSSRDMARRCCVWVSYAHIRAGTANPAASNTAVHFSRTGERFMAFWISRLKAIRVGICVCGTVTAQMDS